MSKWMLIAVVAGGMTLAEASTSNAQFVSVGVGQPRGVVVTGGYYPSYYSYPAYSYPAYTYSRGVYVAPGYRYASPYRAGGYYYGGNRGYYNNNRVYGGFYAGGRWR